MFKKFLTLSMLVFASVTLLSGCILNGGKEYVGTWKATVAKGDSQIEYKLNITKSQNEENNFSVAASNTESGEERGTYGGRASFTVDGILQMEENQYMTYSDRDDTIKYNNVVYTRTSQPLE